MKWNYGDAYLSNPILPGQRAVWENGSEVRVHDIFDPMPDYLKKADMVFVDPPWNKGNLKSFYTKAELTELPEEYEPFVERVFAYIDEIKPRVCYVEIGKEFLADFIMLMRIRFKYVTFYNSSYYHDKKNKCYIIRGSNKARKPDLDYMDEEDVIEWVCANEDYECVADFCMGTGLVGKAAAANGKPFVGGELNPKRLSLLLQKTPGYEIKEVLDG